MNVQPYYSGPPVESNMLHIFEHSTNNNKNGTHTDGSLTNIYTYTYMKIKIDSKGGQVISEYPVLNKHKDTNNSDGGGGRQSSALFCV